MVADAPGGTAVAKKPPHIQVDERGMNDCANVARAAGYYDWNLR